MRRTSINDENTKQLEEHSNELFQQEMKNMADSFGKTFKITKINEEQQLVYGWASIIKDEEGKPIVDSQGDVISVQELQKAAHKFVSKYRVGKENHEGDQKAEIVESIVFTKDLQKMLGINVPVGWLIVSRVNDTDTWARVKSGDLSAFSIGGKGKREAL